MGSLGTSMFSAASIGMSAYQSTQSSQQRLEAELSANNLEAEARRKDQEALHAVQLGRLEQAEEVVKGRAEMAGQKASYAASGVNVNSGSAVEAVADKAAWTEYNRQKIEYKASLESWGLKYDAALLRQKAHNTRATASSGGGNAQAVIGAGKQLSSLIFQ